MMSHYFHSLTQDRKKSRIYQTMKSVTTGYAISPTASVSRLSRSARRLTFVICVARYFLPVISHLVPTKVTPTTRRMKAW